MADTITVTYKVKEDGSLQKISRNADKAAKSTKKATDASAQHNKQQKGVIGATSNSTKAFSKMTTGISGGLVPAYATLAANVFALTALFGALSKAASLRLLEEGLLRVGNAAGTNLSVVAEKLKEITGAAISTEASMRSTALAVSAGFSTKQLESLTKVAKGASVALGRDMTDAMDRLVRGTAKLEPEILDELGIMVRLDDATAEYAITLNKSAKDLTQYERRMAFLTATNEQGLKKFGALADAVDVNPYDKLAASFSNLANKAINVINVALEPIANILSSNPVALMAAVTMFAGTLVSQIVPAITASAEAARKMASATSKEATRLAKQMEGSFKVVAAKIKSLDFAPKSIKKIEADLQAGKIKGKELQQALRNVVQSERLRTAAIKNTTKENLAQKQAELNSVRALRAEIEATAAAEGKRGASSGALGKAKGMSSTSRKTAAAFKMMEGAGPLDGFKIAAASVGKQAKDVGKATGALNKLTLGFSVAGNGAKLFGTALLNAIPVVGQIIMAASILYPLLSKLFEKDDLAQAADKATEAFNSFDGIGDQLGDTLARTTSEAEKFIVTMRVQVGVVEQVSSAFSDMKAAASAMNSEELVESKQKALDLEKSLAHTTEMYGKSGRALLQYEKDHIATIQGRLDLANEQHESLKTTIGLAREAEGILVLDDAIGKIKGNDVLKEELSGTVVGLEALKQKFIEANKEGAGGMSYDQLIKETDALLGENKKVIASVDAAKQVYNDFRKEITDLGDKGSHALDGVLKAQRNLTNEMAAAGGEGGMGTDAFLKQTPELTKTLRKFAKDTLKLSDEIIGNMSLTSVQAAMTAHVAAQKDIMLEQVQVQKKIKVEMGKVKEFAAGNAEATKVLIAMEEEIRSSKEISLKAEKEAFTTLEMQETKKDRLAEINRELAVIDTERANTAVDTLRVGIEGIKHAQKMLDLTTQIASAEKQISLDSMKRATNQIKIAKLSAGKEFGAADELAIFKKNKDERIRLIGVETNAKLLALDLEFKLLEAQTKLQLERAKIVEAENDDIKAGTLTGPMQEVLDLLPTIKTAKAEAIGSSALTQVSDIDAEGASAKRAAQLASLSAATSSSAGALGTTDSTFGRMAAEQESRTSIGEDGEKVVAAPDFANAQERLASMKGMVDPMLESLRGLGPEGELVSAITAGTFAMGDAFAQMGDNIDNSTTTMGKAAAGAEFAAQAISQIGNMMAAASANKVAGIDKEIEAEKKRDGKSAASVAKIKALEKKKEQVERKAFNQQKKMKMAGVIASTAAAIMKEAEKGFPAAIPGIALFGAMGAAQLGIIAGTSYEGGGSLGGAEAGTPSKISIGNRSNTVDLAKSNSASGELAYMRGADDTGGAGNFRPAFSGYKHRAGGGYVVGEQGPEVFMPDVPGEIIASGQGTGGMTNVTFKINTVDATGVEELLMGQKGNIIGMIRDAANSYGESFMDGVDTTVYSKTTEGVSRY